MLKKVLNKFLVYSWQLPQNVLGLLVILFTGAAYMPQHDCWIAINDKSYFGVSLGSYIIFGLGYPGEVTLKHEQGHQKQSLYLGWLYLVLIGIPSAIGNLLFRISFIDRKWDYYKQPWEKWADVLGGVER